MGGMEYAILEVNGEVQCRYEGAGALAIAQADADTFGGMARLATAEEIAMWPN